MKSWAAKGRNQPLLKQGIRVKTMAALVFVAKELGVVHFCLRPVSIIKQTIATALIAVQQRLRRRRVTVFMDNLRAHHSRQVQELITSFGWKSIFNAPYSPEFHCIEELFSLVKRVYRRAMVDRDFALDDPQHRAIVRRSIMSITPDNVARAEEKHFQEMRKYMLENS